ncbi:MAG TPA: hypothetical protein VE954_09730 [Oligoflexus sp.]|uniref:hypothetical protein n=1 Tax=Oligoflexus sp. TaxID=1971216 RepID=UPI002D744C12|nr:hypothetical protein [Oligoflexus sp.]HYX33381.1 hypothetical protein [Oligoflexus sp.]
MKSAMKKSPKKRMELSGYVLGKESRHEAEAALTLLVGLNSAEGMASPMHIVLVRVTGPLARLCNEELLLGDQILVRGIFRSQSFRDASGTLSIIRQLDAIMVIPLHLNL